MHQQSDLSNHTRLRLLPPRARPNPIRPSPSPSPRRARTHTCPGNASSIPSRTRIIARLPTLQPECRVVQASQSPKVCEQEKRTSEEIEDTVEDHLARGRDTVPTFGETPADEVERPDEGDPAGAGVEEATMGCATRIERGARPEAPERRAVSQSKKVSKEGEKGEGQRG